MTSADKEYDMTLLHNVAASAPTTPLLHDQHHQELESEDPPVVLPEEEENEERRRCMGLRSCIERIRYDLSRDQKRQLLVGWTLLILVGSMLGSVLPKNLSLPTKWYRLISSCIGYTYFMSWSVSFYPQVISNYRRKQTTGLSADFCGLNVLGFACYSIYNLAFWCSTTVQDLYRHKHNTDVTVQANDVAFAVHALLLSSLTLVQIGYYNGIRQLKPSKVIGLVMIGIVTTCAVGALALFTFGAASLWYDWLGYLYLLSFFKIMISLIKYIPQVLLNIRRKSTVGWSIWNVLLDLTGGILSDLQLVLDCADMGDWTGITGNSAKLGLGFVSIFFDVIFIFQHYILFREERPQHAPLLQNLQEQELEESTQAEENAENVS